MATSTKVVTPPVFVEWERKLDTTEVEALFGKSSLTIIQWRKCHGMPHIRIPSAKAYSIRYDLAEVLEWALNNNKQVFCDQIPAQFFAAVDPKLLERFGIQFDPGAVDAAGTDTEALAEAEA